MKNERDVSHHKHDNSATGNGHAEHGAHHRHMIADFKRRLLVSAAITIPVLILSPVLQQFFGMQGDFPGREYVIFLLSSTVFFYGGFPFLRGLWQELRAANPGMMTLIALAISVAYTYSSAVAFGLAGKMFFWELVTLIDIMLLGHWIEMRSVLGASRALELLVEMLPSEAHRINGGQIEDVPLASVKKGDVLLVKPGEKVPADGEITDGNSYVNESMLTGESRPVHRRTGDRLIGGSINGEGSVRFRVEGAGADSYLNRVIALVQDAQKAKSRTQRLADNAARWLTFGALSAGAITLAVWLWLGYEFVFALERMVTVMVISCPHALGLAVPLVVAISTALSARNGLLIRNRTAFENSRRITTVVFDKTGTLTQGNFGVARFESISDGFTAADVLSFAAALESESEHPIAIGIVKRARDEQVDSIVASEFAAITGKGVTATVQKDEQDYAVKVVSPGYLREQKIEIPDQASGDRSETIVFVIADEALVGFIALSDAIRAESQVAIQTLHKAGIKTMMATGDNRTVAESVSRELNLDEFFAEVLPHDKLRIVKELQERGEFVAMTGDGVNDAPALAQADVGIAIGSGTDVAAETADIILVRSDPRDISSLVLFGKATHRKMVQNLFWATAYNIFAIPLAGGVLYTAGIVLSPAVGAIFMSLSTVIVAINAQLLKRSARFGDEA
ncbi:MAG: copper-translocating P-type ATPase [Leptospiraceae bacterium]|nr:copper-translocating P-type ATPase [Leptospiraceae bacterium]